jgi:type III pantothenate kinase
VKVLAVDAGNTRVKWGWHDGSAWTSRSAVATLHVDQLSGAWATLGEPDAVIVSNVAGDKARTAIAGASRRFHVPPHWIASVRAQCGVSNGYDDPAQLGSDRWAALIAAWQRHRGATVVVNAGTALTVDALTGDGVFAGGVIVPGAQLMKHALATRTAGLPLAGGRHAPFPANTADAIATGVLDALCGAVERMAQRLKDQWGDAPHCVVSGGAAHELAPRLNLKVELVDNLVLEGLLAIAHDTGSQ